MPPGPRTPPFVLCGPRLRRDDKGPKESGELPVGSAELALGLAELVVVRPRALRLADPRVEGALVLEVLDCVVE